MSVGSSACVFMNWLHTEEGGLARVRLAAFHLPGFVWVCREVTGVESLRSLAAGSGKGPWGWAWELVSLAPSPSVWHGSWFQLQTSLGCCPLHLIKPPGEFQHYR